MPTQKPGTGRWAKYQHSLRISLFCEVSILLLLTVTMTIAVAYTLAKNEVYRRTMIQLEASADAKEHILEQVVSTQREQVATLAQNLSVSNIPAMTRLIGFQSLFSVDTSNKIAVVSGTAPSDELKEFVRTVSTATHTSFSPFFSNRGWESYLIIAPRKDVRGNIYSRLVAVFDSRPLLKRLLDTEYLGDSAEVLMGTNINGELILLHTSRSEDIDAAPVHLGAYEVRLQHNLPLAMAVSGRESVGIGRDYAGIPVIAAYRSTPSIGWGIVAKVDQHEIDVPVQALARRLALIGMLLVVMLSMTMYALAHRITAPLEELANKLRGLEARHWRFARTIFANNEIGQVDTAAEDMARRLRQAHDHLEEMVKDRTQALHEQLAEDEAMFRSIDYGLVVADNAGRIVRMNSAAVALTGWSEEDAKNQSGTHVIVVLNKEGMEISENAHPLTNTLSTKEKFIPRVDEELSLKQREGAVVPLSMLITPIMGGKRCYGAVAILRDVTEERRIDRMKSEFISLVSHQLRTPLSSIRWYTQMLSSGDAGKLNKDQQEFLHEVEKSNVRMMHLIDALLNVSRIELGKLTLNIQPINIVNLVQSAEKLFQKEMADRDITIDYKRCSDAVTTVKSDAVLLQLIVENTISNAIKYSKPHSVVSVDFCVDKEGSATFSVVDTGIGIPANEQAQVYSKMFRATNARTSDTDGNGLGLYTSRMAAELLGAKLDFKSKEGKGTTFTLTLPA